MSHAEPHADAPTAPHIQEGYSGVITPRPAAADHGVGPVMTDTAYQAYLDKLAAHPLLREDNIRLPDGSGKALSRGLLGLGVVALAIAGFLGGVFNIRHLLAAYEVGVFTVLACSLGSLFLVMVFQMMNTYWTVTIRRQLEHAAGLVWVPWLMLAPVVVVELISGGVLLPWIGDQYEGNLVYEHKAGYLNGGFFLVRYLVYGVIWITLSRSLTRMSREQDFTGDRWLTRKMRRLSGFGLLLFALSVPFAAFDFLMAMDFRFFSTMWGVYFFAGAIMTAVAVCAVVLSVLRTFGRLTGVVTAEHYHDLGKLAFAFTVFWAYIAFSQYFLIWYGNIPEETNYFLARTTGAWKPLAVIIVLGHFVIPFFLLITRKTKRNTIAFGALGLFLILMQVLDMVFIIRPMVYVRDYIDDAPGYVGWALDVIAVAGVLALFAGAMVTKIVSGPLLPTRDPRLAQCLKHKNYV